jgi:NAD(P)-dependent dehydrogenase (short-subunit alcohol dehydrogenase family)
MSTVKELYDITGQTAIVTGASSGLGVVFAEALAECGVNIVICARREEKLRNVAKQLKIINGARVLPFPCDVTNENAVEEMVEKTVDEFGSVEILVNNAGISAISPSTEMALDDWKKVIEVNLTGVFICARVAARKMIEKQYGKIINIASIYGEVGDVFAAAPYYASKGGVVNLTRSMAVEWAKHKIYVNAIEPGFFPSEMTTPIFQDTETYNYIKSRTPLGKVGNPADLKGALIFFASPASNYVTGQTLAVDGGWTAL